LFDPESSKRKKRRRKKKKENKAKTKREKNKQQIKRKSLSSSPFPPLKVTIVAPPRLKPLLKVSHSLLPSLFLFSSSFSNSYYSHHEKIVHAWSLFTHAILFYFYFILFLPNL
jgi:hypothetical protein